MNENVGIVIKKLAGVLMWMGIIASFIAAIVIWAIGEEESFFTGLIYLVLGLFSSWVSGVLLYGFGQLIDNTGETNSKLHNISIDINNLKSVMNAQEGNGNTSHTIIETSKLGNDTDDQISNNHPLRTSVEPDEMPNVPTFKYDSTTEVITKGDMQGNKYYKQIVIPNGVTKIEDRAFYECTALEIVFLPSTLTSIGSEVFAECTNLTSLFLPDSINEMGSGIIKNCKSLKTLGVPCKLHGIEAAVFSGCVSLEHIYFHNNLNNWKQIKKQDGWKPSNGSIIIHCDDGTCIE